jgi:antitoxin component YwqK of YwqJK toxin-antitoxin module
MKKNRVNQAYAILLFCLTANFLFSQDKLNYEPSINPLLKGEEYMGEGEYEMAFQQFDKVHEGDSMFFRYAVHLKMSALNNLEEYKKAKDIGDKYWYFRHELPTEFYLNYGTALDKLEEYDQAQKMYKSILEEYPTNYSLWYNLGISHLLEGDNEEAYATFKQTIEINPFYDRVHLAMAQLAFSEQQTAKGLMAVGMHLMHSITKRDNFAQLRYGDYMASSKYWADDDFSGSNELELEGNSNFETIDELIHNYVALRDKYKTTSKLEFPLIKQLHLIASQLKAEGPKEDDYWYETYGKFYVVMLDEKQFEGFSYLISSYAENAKIQKVVVKNEKELKEAYVWCSNYLSEQSKEADLSFMGLGETKVSRNSDNHHIELLGDFELINNGQNVVGDIKFYGAEGRMTAEGTFNEEGNKEGLWKYYHSNGRLKEKQITDNGDPIDTMYSYNPNGLLRLKVPYQNGKVDGNVLIFDNGVLSRTLPYKDGAIGSGEMVDYHTVGTEDIRLQVLDGKANGPFKSYYDSGEIYREGKQKDGDLIGERITYFKTGEISYKENFLDGVKDGEYVSYYFNGQLEAKGTYKEGNKVGKWEYFYRNGNKRSVESFDERGKENGLEINYTKQGWKLSEYTYNKGMIDSYKFFNQEGDILSQDERKAGELKYIAFYQNGLKSSEGNFNKEGKDGEWKFYNYNGSLDRIEKYKDGIRIGDYEKYFANGDLEIKYSFDENGNSNGYYRNYYRNGKLYRQGFLKDGERDGPWETYHRNGALKSSNFYNDFESQGFSTSYDIVGNPIRSVYYKDDLSEFTIYYDTAGVAFDTIMETPGKRKVELRRCETCPVFMTANVLNNAYHGEQVFIYPDGTLEAKGEVFNGGKEGPWKTYYSTGVVASEGAYMDGDRHGEWKFYFNDGTLRRKSNYKFGKLNGAYETYDESGVLDFKANYFAGDLHGEVSYYIGGKKEHSRIYNYGYIESYTFTDENGKEITKPMKNETAEISTYWKNGKLARKFSIQQGWFQGPYLKFFENGNKAEEQNYKDDLREGAFKEYYRNGKLKKEGTYEQGDVVGTFTTYYANGKKRTEEEYVQDQRHGKGTYYNSDGSIDRVITYINGNVIAIEKK